MKIDLIYLIFGIITTMISYCIVHFTLRITGHRYNEKKTNKIVIINAIIIFIMYSIININNNIIKLASIGPAFLYSFINYYILLERKKESKKNQ